MFKKVHYQLTYWTIWSNQINFAYLNTVSERKVCKDLGEICGYIGPGIDSTCCNNMECTTNGNSGIGAAFTCEVKEQGKKQPNT